MRGVTRAFALLGGLAVSGLTLSPAAIAADLEPVVEEPAGPNWYISIFGGPKWGDGDVDVKEIFRPSECPTVLVAVVICDISTLVNGNPHEADLHGEVDDGILIGGAVGAQLTEHIRAEIEVSHARLDTETEVVDYVLFDSGATYSESDEDKLRELFVMANVWFGIPLTDRFSAYLGGGAGVAHVDAEFSVPEFSVGVNAVNHTFSASIEADGWNFAYQLGGGLLIGLSETVAIDLGYRLKIIPNVDLDEPEFCGGECHPPVESFEADDDFDIIEHVAQIGLTIGF